MDAVGAVSSQKVQYGAVGAVSSQKVQYGAGGAVSSQKVQYGGSWGSVFSKVSVWRQLQLGLCLLSRSMQCM
jgi:hypothetical protein